MLHLGGLFFNCYGDTPYTVAVVHGGPGAAGEMAQVAQTLSTVAGVVEPFQTKMTLTAQVQELKSILEQSMKSPAIVVGYSWGAMLTLLVASQYPQLFKKIILVSCPPLETLPGFSLMDIRKQRLSVEEQAEFIDIDARITSANVTEREKLFKRLKDLMDKADEYSPDEKEKQRQSYNFSLEIFEGVWPEAAQARQEGHFMALLRSISCPVVFIHGSYDPHPLQAAEKAAAMIKNSQVFVLDNCGHTPWIEKEAKAAFYELLFNAIEGEN
jgi:pimeloyl-ACP methyl ester carboxylesterase